MEEGRPDAAFFSTVVVNAAKGFLPSVTLPFILRLVAALATTWFQPPQPPTEIPTICCSTLHHSSSF
jgi:hypothetical protein